MNFPYKDKLCFTSACVIGLVAMLTACCVLERRLEAFDYYDEQPNVVKMPFMANSNILLGDAQ